MSKKIVRRATVWLNVICDFIISFWGSKANILTAKETKDYVIKNRKSIIRLGDGEFNILNKKDIEYQKYNINLEKEMRKTISEYIEQREKCAYILCVPHYFMKCTGIKLLKRKLISSWSYTRKIFQKSFPQDITYGDAFLFARENDKIYEEIWLSKKSEVKNCIFVHRDIKYAKNFENKFNIKTTFVKIPEKDSYEKCEEILNDIEDKITEAKEVIVLISAGPAGKILVYRLANKGIWAVDAGHCWDNPLIDRKA